MMPKSYVRLTDDVAAPGRWHLRSPTDSTGQDVDPWCFTNGAPVPEPGRLRLPVARAGKALDFTLTGLAIPVVHVRVAAVFLEHAPGGVQVFPVEIQGQPDQYCILVATQTIRCIDDKACREVEPWLPEDGRPEKTGEYRDVDGLRIDVAKVGDAQVFRTWGWTVALIVSDTLKEALARAGTTGMSFVEV
ncbi:imm11 family protein [Corallococcus terminator]